MGSWFAIVSPDTQNDKDRFCTGSRDADAVSCRSFESGAAVYETNIKTALWQAYDIPGNNGRLLYFAGFGRFLAVRSPNRLHRKQRMQRTDTRKTRA